MKQRDTQKTHLQTIGVPNLELLVSSAAGEEAGVHGVPLDSLHTVLVGAPVVGHVAHLLVPLLRSATAALNVVDCYCGVRAPCQ